MCVSGVGANICSILCIHYYSTEKENSLKRLRILFSDRMQYELITRALIYSHIATRKQFRSFNGGCARLLLSKELKTLFKEINICISLNKSLYPQFNVSKQRKNALPHQSKQDQRESRKQCSSTPFFKPLFAGVSGSRVLPHSHREDLSNVERDSRGKETVHDQNKNVNSDSPLKRKERRFKELFSQNTHEERRVAPRSCENDMAHVEIGETEQEVHHQDNFEPPLRRKGEWVDKNATRSKRASYSKRQSTGRGIKLLEGNLQTTSQEVKAKKQKNRYASPVKEGRCDDFRTSGNVLKNITNSQSVHVERPPTIPPLKDATRVGRAKVLSESHSLGQMHNQVSNRNSAKVVTEVPPPSLSQLSKNALTTPPPPPPPLSKIQKMKAPPPPPPPPPPSVKPGKTAPPPPPPPPPQSLSTKNNGVPPPPPPPPLSKLGKGNAPPPPPPSGMRQKASSANQSKIKTMFQKKSREIVKIFQATMREQMKQERKKRVNNPPGTSHAAQNKSQSDPNDVKFELESKSKHIAKIKEDVTEHGEMIKTLAIEIKNFSGSTDALLSFVKTMESKLMILSDENQVLKFFQQWPQAKMDALRESSALIHELQSMADSLGRWEHQKEDSIISKFDKYQAKDLISEAHHDIDKIQPRVERIMCESKNVQEKFIKFKIDLKIDELLGTVKDTSLIAAVAAMKTALLHLTEDKAQMLKTFKFAFRVHQFSLNGFEGDACDLFRQLHIHLQNN